MTQACVFDINISLLYCRNMYRAFFSPPFLFVCQVDALKFSNRITSLQLSDIRNLYRFERSSGAC